MSAALDSADQKINSTEGLELCFISIGYITESSKSNYPLPPLLLITQWIRKMYAWAAPEYHLDFLVFPWSGAVKHVMLVPHSSQLCFSRFESAGKKKKKIKVPTYSTSPNVSCPHFWSLIQESVLSVTGLLIGRSVLRTHCPCCSGSLHVNHLMPVASAPILTNSESSWELLRSL